MNAETKVVDQNEVFAQAFDHFVRSDFAGLKPLTQRIAELNRTLNMLAEIGDEATIQRSRKLRQKLATIEPCVTMIGQVKAGKTSLVNAMVGWPDLLPADVNPWTSVVTSLHLNPQPITQTTKAQFRFFEKNEWDRLVMNGGRMGELAGRAGATGEADKLRLQIAEMREKSERRLGRKFELLLGQTHDYGYFDSELIERYVCLGDEIEDDQATTKKLGRFADITKSAEVHLHRPVIPIPLCIRDTPGVNDTFMVREQITIRAIRDSRICVVVLSAHQALSSVDMALIRLIANIKSREVIIFVNRIDELSDPARQVPEIRDSISATLRDHQGPGDAQIIFGSAYWANQALRGRDAKISPDSLAALQNWAKADSAAPVGDTDQEAALWRYSGVPALFAALSDRIVEGSGQDVIKAVAKSALTLANGLCMSNNIVTMRKTSANRPKLDRIALKEGLQRIEGTGGKVLDAEYTKLIAEFDSRVDVLHQNFLQRATAALVDHLEVHGDSHVWKYDPTGLRVLLRSAYQLFAKRSSATTRNILTATASDISKLYLRSGLIKDSGYSIAAPNLPNVPPPVLLGQTIALDLQSNWWSRWWRKRRGYGEYAEEFYRLIQAESAPIITGLKNDHVLAIRADALATFAEFVNEQANCLANISDQDSMKDQELAAAFGGSSWESRQSVLDNALLTLNDFAA